MRSAQALALLSPGIRAVVVGAGGGVDGGLGRGIGTGDGAGIGPVGDDDELGLGAGAGLSGRASGRSNPHTLTAQEVGQYCWTSAVYCTLASQRTLLYL